MQVKETARRKTKTVLSFRSPHKSDGIRLHRLIEECKPLDLNSPYLYFLLSEHFSRTCVLAEAGDVLAGALTAYRPPERPGVIFIWQIAVAPSMRGQGVGLQMLKHLLSMSSCRDVRFVELTVSPSNTASRNLFYSLAKKLNTGISEHDFLGQEAFGGLPHEEEKLLRIGPVKKSIMRGYV